MAEVSTLNMDPSGEINNIEELLNKLNIPNIVQAILGMDTRKPWDLVSILGLMRTKEVNKEKKDYTKD